MTAGPADDHLLYLRKSNGRKAIARQRAITTGYVRKRGGRVLEEFADADRTAFARAGEDAPERRRFAAMLAVLRSSPGVSVAAWHADRLTRNDSDTAELIRVCSAGGHLVVTASGGTYDLSTANGRRRFRDDASAAIYEVDHNRERVLEARAEVAAEGRWLGGKRPFGWEPDPDPPLDEDGEPWLDDDGNLKKGILRLRRLEADALAKATLDVIAGRGGGSIERDWRAAGILTASGKPFRWGDIRRLILRARNAGLMEHGGQVTGPAHWPPIVDETTWRAAASLLSDPARRSSPGPARQHLLSFIARCGVCQGPMICSSTTRGVKGGGRRRVYRCRDGGHVTRDAAQLDALAETMVFLRAGRDEANLLDPPERDSPAETLSGLYQEKAEIEALMTQRDRLHRQRVITDQMLIDGLAELRGELAAVQERIDEASRADALAPLAGDPVAGWEGMDLQQRRAAVSRLLVITVHPARGGRPAGWKPGASYFDSRTVGIKWKRRITEP
jgi:site-specific DNA recombinase